MLTIVERFLVEHGAAAYYVGGYVRDRLLGRETRDIDIAVAADGPALAREVASALGGTFVLLDGEQGIARVVFSCPAVGREVGGAGDGRWTFDFSTMQGDLEADLRRRDFTVDAMAVRVGDGAWNVIDPLHGAEALRAGSLRAASRAAFQQDPARLLRAVRLAAQYELTIEPETESLIRDQAHLLSSVAGERVREELCHLLVLPQAARRLYRLDDLGLLTVIFPELAAARGVEQPGEHYWDVFDHCLNTVAALDRLLACAGSGGPDELCRTVAALYAIEGAAGHLTGKIGNVRRSALMKLASLLHDIAKPQTKSTEPDGRVRFFGHSTEGAAVAKEVMGRLRFSAQQSKAVQAMVEHHMRPWQLSSDERAPSRRAIYRYYRDLGDMAVDTVWLAFSDYLATREPLKVPLDAGEHVETLANILQQGAQGERNGAPPRLVDGHDLMSSLGIAPGPRVGEMLQALLEAQATGEISTREEALDLARRLHSA